MKYQIKNRWSGVVMFECELSAEAEASPESVKLGFTVKVAISARADLGRANLAGADLARANLDGANLAGANLDGANLAGANLDGANLASAYLARADLAGAYLAGADLARADLARANLAGADLARANLDGANLASAYLARADLAGALLDDKSSLVGSRPILMIGPIGSASRYLVAYLTNKGLRLRAGCFFGSREAFEEKLQSRHGDNEHAREYRAALALIDVHAAIWTPENQNGQ